METIMLIPAIGILTLIMLHLGYNRLDKIEIESNKRILDLIDNLTK